MRVDFGKTAADYGTHRAGFPDRFFDRLIAAGFVKNGDRLLDLGTGTGTVARGFARRGCTVTGLDPSRQLLEEAARLDRDAGVSVSYVEAKAEETGLAPESFDVVTAGQCWHWFDRPRAAREARRVLKPRGILVIAHFDWIPLPNNVVDATEKLIEKHNPSWKLGGGHGLHPHWLADAAVAGFEDIETFSFDEPARYTHEGWRGRIRASAGVAASLAPDAVARFDEELAALLARDFPEDPMPVPHRVWVMTARSPRQR
ncbi:MAG TPA: class I SAM-dependent methyltransferase [Candidatus Eremiobacteraceae bacterium]|nr:class I SAM-dependent methyltransferase [Candidatus Eremiobacteraceae bacterium]